MNFFNDKILTIKEKIDGLLPSTSADLSSDVGTLDAAVGPDACLDAFSSINLDQLTSLFSKSKSSTCLLDPIPTKLLKEVFPLVSTSLLDIMNLPLYPVAETRTFNWYQRNCTQLV
uniref:Uncharacterized protein n=1 Tax=Gasterosteus aculeatus aculeatus TaxID=481459 RepID=A0AAQ4QDU3_GASAC